MERYKSCGGATSDRDEILTLFGLGGLRRFILVGVLGLGFAAGQAAAGDVDLEIGNKLADMLRAGASEVVVQPCPPEEIARKVWRAVRKG